MCDALCVLGPDTTLFAKNSDRPPGEVQLVAAHGRRPPGATLRTQYLALPDTGAVGTLLARPAWLWGAEHGVNDRRVAVGNERVYTVPDPGVAPPALIGMDLVRLVLERAHSADEGVEILGALLDRWGQGGVADAAHDEAYDSSFLVADPQGAWVVETAGRQWAAARAPAAGLALSNRLTLRAAWDRASGDVAPGTDIDRWRDPRAPTGHADRRLAASRGFVARGGGPGDVVALLRDHGEAGRLPPTELGEDGRGVTLCMHVAGYMATTSSMVASLPRDPEAPARCWVAPGAPCATLYVPAFPPQPACPDGAVPAALADEQVWRAGARLRRRVERGAAEFEAVRAVLDPLEAELWDEAESLAAAPGKWQGAVGRWSARVSAALSALSSEADELRRPRLARG